MLACQSRTKWGTILAALTLSVPGAVNHADASPNTVQFKTLAIFNLTDGWTPNSPLVQGTDGNLYGVTYSGGAFSSGVVFKMTPSGTLSVLYSFCGLPLCADGARPNWVALGSDGNFYGTTASGGANPGPNGIGGGTFFKITPGGSLTTLYSFCALANCGDGNNPTGIAPGSNGHFYGTTSGGGNAGQSGVVFDITRDGALTTIYTFCSQAGCTDGATPAAPVMQGLDGSLYGTSKAGGMYGQGTVFKVTLAGVLTTLHSFNATDGAMPGGELLQAAGGQLFGTAQGGAYGAGTIFKITPMGAFTTLYNFCAQTNCPDGADISSRLMQATDGNFYGETTAGGSLTCPVYLNAGCGTAFTMTPAGTLTTLHQFNKMQSYSPGFGLVQRTNGALYGATAHGGQGTPCSGGCGTVFELSVGLGAFVETVPASGKVGDVIQILGTNLTGATSVSFNGAAAMFTVQSSSLISATVPNGATTGFVTVTMPGRTLRSNVTFRVQP